MRETTIRQFSSGEIDLEQIRKVAGNKELTADEVFDFPPFIIARSGRNHNRSDISAEGQKAAVTGWIGKPVYFEDHRTEARNQIARIYHAETKDENGETVTIGRAYAIKTESNRDLLTSIRNGIHREMSCGYEITKSVCNLCGIDVLTADCPQHASDEKYYVRDLEFTPDHVSFVGRPGVEGAGLIAASRKQSTDPQLTKLAEDGKAFRSWAADEFGKWYGLTNPNASDETVKDLTGRLSASEMLTFARIEKDRYHEVVPDGRQQLEAPEQTETTAQKHYKSEKEIFGERPKIWQ